MYTKRVRVRLSGGNITLTIPRELARHYDLTPGQAFDLVCDGNKMVVDLTSVERTKLFDQPEIEIPQTMSAE